MPLKTASTDDLKGTVALRTAVRIMQNWKATNRQIAHTLRISRKTCAQALTSERPIRVDCDQLTRISLILNIHASLRHLFDNPENVHGFPSMGNNNSFFNGRSPLDIISQGSIIALYQTFQRINSLAKYSA